MTVTQRMVKAGYKQIAPGCTFARSPEIRTSETGNNCRQENHARDVEYRGATFMADVHRERSARSVITSRPQLPVGAIFRGRKFSDRRPIGGCYGCAG